MISNFSEHTNANYFLHTGNGQQGRPSMGAWLTYGLGSECQDLPGFVVLDSGMIPPGGSTVSATAFCRRRIKARSSSAANSRSPILNPAKPTRDCSRAKLGLLRKLDQGVVERLGQDDKLESAIANYELAFRMQTAVPDLMDLGGEIGGHQGRCTASTNPPTRAVRPAMPARPPAGRARRALRRAAVSRTSATTAGTSTAT